VTAPSRALAFALLMGVVSTASAHAQARPAKPDARFEVSFGGMWMAGAGLGSTSADLRANNLTPTPFRLFSAETRVAAAPGWDARAAYWLTRSIAVDGGVARLTPDVRTRVTADAEGAPALTASERLDQYFIDARVVWLLPRFNVAGLEPFVSGGGGYLRQLHEGRTLVETGQVYQAGGGVRRQVTTDVGWFRSIGVKLDGRVYVLVDGVQLEEGPRTHGAFSGSVFLSF
jgi:hypothetical protein